MKELSLYLCSETHVSLTNNSDYKRTTTATTTVVETGVTFDVYGQYPGQLQQFLL